MTLPCAAATPVEAEFHGNFKRHQFFWKQEVRKYDAQPGFKAWLRQCFLCQKLEECYKCDRFDETIYLESYRTSWVQRKQLIHTTQSVLQRNKQLWDVRRLFGVDCLGWTNPSTCFHFCWSFFCDGSWKHCSRLCDICPVTGGGESIRKLRNEIVTVSWWCKSYGVATSGCNLNLHMFANFLIGGSAILSLPCLNLVAGKSIRRFPFGRCFALGSLPWSQGGDEEQSSLLSTGGFGENSLRFCWHPEDWRTSPYFFNAGLFTTGEALTKWLDSWVILDICQCLQIPSKYAKIRENSSFAFRTKTTKHHKDS